MIESLIGQGINVRHACRVLGVSESGYYDWKGRPDPPRTLRRIWLAGEIADVHKASGGTYGENTDLRRRLGGAGSEYVLSVSRQVAVFAPETHFEVPLRKGETGRPRTRPQPDRAPEPIGSLIERIGEDEARTVAFRDGPDGEPVASHFAFVRVRASHEWQKRPSPPPEEWLIAEWPDGAEAPPSPSAWRGSPECAGRSSSTTAN